MQLEATTWGSTDYRTLLSLQEVLWRQSGARRVSPGVWEGRLLVCVLAQVLD